MADGDARLQVVLEAKIDKLQDSLSKANQTIGGWAKRAQKDIDTTETRFRLFGEGGGKALANVFDRSRLATLEEGTAKIPIFGSAIEALGPAGLAAAAGIGATAIALERAHDATEFADKLEETAKKLHVSTDALQEYRFALFKAGGEEAGADAALEAFSITLGKAQAGLPKAQKAFKELGFSTDQIKGFKDVDGALQAVTERIASLGKNAQKDAVIDQLGLTSMKPLILAGLDKLREFKAEAHDIGVVMDEGMVKRGAALNKEFETLLKVIDVQLKSAFIDLAPILVGLVSKLAEMATAAADIADSFRAIEDKSVGSMRRELADRLKQNASFGLNPEPAQKTIEAANEKRIAELEAELTKRERERQPVAPADGKDLADQDALKRAQEEARKALERRVASEQAIDTSTAEELNARKALTKDTEQLRDLQLAEVDAQTKKANDKLRGEAAEGKINQAAADTAITMNNRAAVEKKALIEREAGFKIEEDWLAHQATIDKIYSEIAGLAEQMARTAGERRSLQLKELEAQKRITDATLREAKEKALAENRIGDANNIDAQIAAENDRYGAQRSSILHNTMGPLEAWRDASLKTAAEVSEALQGVAVQGLDSFTSGLTDAILHTKSLGQVFHDVAGQIIADLLQIAIRRSITQPLANALFGGAGNGVLAGAAGLLGFANGTDFAPGGAAIVGERGPEVLNLPRGAQVVPNDILRGLSGSAGGGVGSLHLNVTVNADGAIPREEIESMVARGSMQAVSAAREIVRGDLNRAAARRL